MLRKHDMVLTLKISNTHNSNLFFVCLFEKERKKIIGVCVLGLIGLVVCGLSCDSRFNPPKV